MPLDYHPTTVRSLYLLRLGPHAFACRVPGSPKRPIGFLPAAQVLIDRVKFGLAWPFFFFVGGGEGGGGGAGGAGWGGEDNYGPFSYSHLNQ